MRNSAVANTYGNITDVIDKSVSFVLNAQMSGAWLRINSGSGVTVTIPVGLPEGFNCLLHNEGAGLITVVGASGVTVNSSGGLLSASAQHVVLSLFSYDRNIYNLSGSLA